jgi:hypothetical protein
MWVRLTFQYYCRYLDFLTRLTSIKQILKIYRSAFKNFRIFNNYYMYFAAPETSPKIYNLFNIYYVHSDNLVTNYNFAIRFVCTKVSETTVYAVLSTSAI